MGPAVFFVLGLPLAFVCNQLVLKLTDFEEEMVEGANERKLPWQIPPWATRVRWGVVLLLPVFMAVAGSRFGVAQAALISLIVGGLLVCTATDLLRYRVPNVITYPSIVVALLAAVFMPDSDLISAVLAALAAGFCFLVLALVTRGGLGLGDVKLAVLIGALLGLNAVAAIFWGVIAGGIVIFVLYATGVVGRKEPVPYAPFLALAAISVALLQGAAFAPL